jgi:hypothetical protein
VMHETTLYYSTEAIRHTTPENSKNHTVHSQACGTILQCFLAVLVSGNVVSALVPITEHSP